MGSEGRKSPRGVQGQSPWWELGGQSPRNGDWGVAPRSGTGFNDYKDFLVDFFSNKIIYSITRTLTNMLMFSRQLLK